MTSIFDINALAATFNEMKEYIRDHKWEYADGFDGGEWRCGSCGAARSKIADGRARHSHLCLIARLGFD
jgi:hypothetical protein